MVTDFANREIGDHTMPSIEQFETKDEHAAWLNTTPRTLDNWRNIPNGLPYTKAGNKPLFCREWTLEWLGSRRRQNNPTRKRAAA